MKREGLPVVTKLSDALFVWCEVCGQIAALHENPYWGLNKSKGLHEGGTGHKVRYLGWPKETIEEMGMKSKWTKQPVPVAVRTGLVLVDGEVIGGLGVHRRLILDGPETGDSYVITHVASGGIVASCGLDVGRAYRGQVFARESTQGD